MQNENCKLKNAERDFGGEFVVGIELIEEKYDAGDWRGVARVANSIRDLAKAAEREREREQTDNGADWLPDDVVGLGPAAEEYVLGLSKNSSTTENT